MGPESTAIFYHALIKQCQEQYGAQYDEDYPEIFIYNLPIPDVVEGLKNEQKTLEMLVQGAKKVDSIGVDVLVMPCNTVHYFYPDMAKSISTPFICIFLATAKKIKSEGYKKVGFLATDTTITQKSYDKDFERNGIDLIFPDEQEKVTSIIMNILAGKKLDEDKTELKRIIQALQEKGAEAIVLACTDLPILLKQEDVNIKIFDTVEILAEATVEYAIGKIGDEILE
ncbi:amino acid racemase [Patescibacteria group bacterium]|nr:amino acid racemase [Patescibacteria group bacterium]